MKSRLSSILTTNWIFSCCLVMLLLLICFVNLSPGASLFSDSEPTEQTLVMFEEADPDFSTDVEIDPIDASLIQTFSADFLIFNLDSHHTSSTKSAGFTGIHLEIPIPPPRLNS